VPRKKPFRIGRSRTGLGLFATEPIGKHAFIVEYKGPWLPNEQAEKLEARGNRYLYEINSRWTIDGSSRRNIGRYANHSCRPNAESHRIRDKIILRAIRNIRPGEEITYDYGDDYLQNVITRRGCKCVKCREKRSARQREWRRRKRLARRRALRARRSSRKQANGKWAGNGRGG
jgi:SET domain-containing protein